jgi:hypothetical protein
MPSARGVLNGIKYKSGPQKGSQITKGDVESSCIGEKFYSKHYARSDSEHKTPAERIRFIRCSLFSKQQES